MGGMVVGMEWLLGWSGCVQVVVCVGCLQTGVSSRKIRRHCLGSVSCCCSAYLSGTQSFYDSESF